MTSPPAFDPGAIILALLRHGVRFVVIGGYASCAAFAIGRKNWLSAGSEGSAERACVIYSQLASCKLHRVNAVDYLRDVRDVRFRGT